MSAWNIAFVYFTACGFATGLLACIAKEFRLIFAFYLFCWLFVLCFHYQDELTEWAVPLWPF